jgi:hypothetical protein
MKGLQRFLGEFLADIRKGKFDVSENGILLRGGSVIAQGFYVEGVRGQPASYRRHKNLIVTEGINHILDVYFGATSKASAFYLAPFSGSATPAASWNASNFASNATEITSTSEGYEETTRQQASFGTAASGAIDNYASKAAFTIATASQLTVKGLGLLTTNTRGGTSGKLVSAVKFSVDRVLNDGDIWEAGYQATLADS